MKANELRIGNWVYDYDEELIIVSGISYGYVYSSKLGETTLARIKPIPLTEEWLVKFGLVYDGSNFFYDYLNNDSINETLSLETTGGIDDLGTIEIGIFSAKFDNWGVIEDTMINCTLKHIKYVHQLQNLFYILNGKDLELIH
jgi:hypothetical protein